MTSYAPTIVLASKSPRRRALFSLITDNFIFADADADESGFETLPPGERVMRLAEIKCRSAAAEYPQSVVIGCDTLVELDGEVLGKPLDEADAFRMLRTLSGKTHSVYTGVHICFPIGDEHFFRETKVSFFDISDEEISEYISTKEPFDKAGAYGIQGAASKYVRGIDGDYFNVMGLPVSLIYRRLRARNIV